jgi:acyl CoA:acetate/3-ketoacid CoA transferase alpha subunit
VISHDISYTISFFVIKGSNWGALLVAGDDENPEKAAAMKREILELERVVTSKAPRIIGIR